MNDRLELNKKPKTKMFTIRDFAGSHRVKGVFVVEYQVTLRDKWGDNFDGIQFYDTLQEAMTEFQGLKPRVDDPNDEAFSVEVQRREEWWDTTEKGENVGLIDDEYFEVEFHGSREYEEA